MKEYVSWLGFCQVCHCMTYLEVRMTVDFDSLLKPRDLRRRISFCNANEDNLVTQIKFVVEMGRLYYFGSLPLLVVSEWEVKNM